MVKALKWLLLSLLMLAFPTVNAHATIPAADGTYSGRCLRVNLGPTLPHPIMAVRWIRPSGIATGMLDLDLLRTTGAPCQIES